MATAAERTERKETASRVADLLSMDEHTVVIHRKDLVELARFHPLLRDKVPAKKRKAYHWRTQEGQEEAKGLIAKFKEENGRLPHTQDLKDIGLVRWYTSTFSGTGFNARRHAYVVYLHETGYTHEEIVSARLTGVSSPERVDRILTSHSRRA